VRGRSIPRLLGWMGGALVCFSAMAVAIRELAPLLGVADEQIGKLEGIERELGELRTRLWA